MYMGDTEHRKIWPLGGYFSAIMIVIMNTFCVGTCAFGRFVSSFLKLHQMMTHNSTLLLLVNYITSTVTVLCWWIRFTTPPYVGM